jgi:hypothetical protein
VTLLEKVSPTITQVKQVVLLSVEAVLQNIEPPVSVKQLVLLLLKPQK